MTTCMHPSCSKVATAIVSYEAPEHPDFEGVTHDCCGDHGPAHHEHDPIVLDDMGGAEYCRICGAPLPAEPMYPNSVLLADNAERIDDLVAFAISVRPRNSGLDEDYYRDRAIRFVGVDAKALDKEREDMLKKLKEEG